MTAAKKKTLAGEDLLELQRATGKRYELVKGIPIETTPAGGKHIKSVDEIDSGFLTVAPDLVVAVVSQSNKRSDATAKVEAWKRAGVETIWLADLERRTATVYSGNAAVVLTEDQTLVGKNLLQGFLLLIKTIFS